MIRKLLLFIAVLCWSFSIHAQNNNNSNWANPINISPDGSYQTCFSSDAVGYYNSSGVYYYNYSKTIKVSNNADVGTVMMSDKNFLWTENDGTVYALYWYDGTTKRKVSTTWVSGDVKVTPEYILYLGWINSYRQIFRYNRATGVTTQLTNEATGCYNLMITDPRAATLSYAYACQNSLKPGYYNLISSFPGTPRLIVSDEYSSGGVFAGGYIYFNRNTNGVPEVVKSKPFQTGYSSIYWYSNTILDAYSDQYIAVKGQYSTTVNYFFVANAETGEIVYSKYASASFSSFKINQNRFCWLESDGHDNEVRYFNGKNEIQITNNDLDDYFPFINNAGNVAWIASDEVSESNIMYYNATTGVISQINKTPEVFDNMQMLDGGNFLVRRYGNQVSEPLLYTTSSYKFGGFDFRCDETSKNGSAVLSIEKPLNPGVIGLDFKVTYDPAAVSIGSVDLLSTTDANGNTASLTYTVSGNTVNISYYLRSAAPGTSIISTGPILGINLVRNATTTYTSNYSLLKVSDIDESYAVGIVKGELPFSASYNISPETYAGLLLYGANASKPMAHSASNPAAVFQSDYACVQQPLTSAVVNPGTNGIFRINKNTVNTQLQILKDLPGSYTAGCSSSNIMTFLNGSDWALAAEISKGNTSGVTSPLQYIAADVNMDGKVSAGDAALISSRSVLKICEYPQAWNYVLQNGFPVPGPNYRPSKDFVFVHESIFTASASKNSVPKVTDCLPMPSAQNCPANDAVATKYAGILLGDANLSYYPTNVLTRIGAVNDVEFSSDEDPGIVNVSGICRDTLKSLDFRIVLPEGVKVEDVVPAYSGVNLNWNAIDSLLLVTSYVDGDATASEQLFRIILKNGLLNNLSTGDFYINGEPAGFANRIVNGTTDLVRKQVKISPNPTAGKFKIEFRESRSGFITVTDIEGKIFSKTFADGTSQELNIEEEPAGVYFVKVESENTTEVYKIVKQ
jgi:hypothetical protein